MAPRTDSALAGSRRPALDGVRALAVLAVIAYHVGGRYRGGFLGVDVFFVLSGYLITSILLDEQRRSGAVDLAGFWFRRARRLLPALLIVVATCAVVTAASTGVAELAGRRDDLLSSIFYYANWHFIDVDADYFAANAAASPLRHMWSLAIEEQFYIVWPLVVIAAVWAGRGRRGVLLGVVGAGIVASAALTAARYDPAYPSRAYFGTDTHASGLLVGAALAIAFAGRPALRDGATARRVAAWAWPPVLLLLAAFVLGLDDEQAFYYRGGALLFAVAVGLAIWAVETLPRSPLGRFLSLRPIAWIGLISYGLYLWHWPLLVWLGDPSGGGSRATQIGVVVATFAIATASFYLVERPLRRGRAPWIRGSRLRFAGAIGVAAGLAAAGSVWATDISSSDRLAAQTNDRSEVQCPESRPWCVLVEPRAGAPLIATAGDSTSLALTPGMQQLAAERGYGFAQTARGGCSVVPMAFVATPSDRALLEQGRDCVAFAEHNIDQVIEARRPDVWVISDRFLLNPIVLADGTVVDGRDPRHDDLVTKGVRGVIGRMLAAGARVAVLDVPPKSPPVDCGAKRSGQCGDASHSAGDPESAHLNAVLRRAVARFPPGRAAFISVSDRVCGTRGPCRIAEGSTLVRWDGVHYTTGYSKLLAPVIVDRMRRAGIAPRVAERTGR